MTIGMNSYDFESGLTICMAWIPYGTVWKRFKEWVLFHGCLNITANLLIIYVKLIHKVLFYFNKIIIRYY